MAAIGVTLERCVNLLRPFSTDAETGGHDPDDRVSFLIDAERLPDHVGASGEALLPECITENEHMGRAGRAFLLPERPPKLGRHAQQLENSGSALNGWQHFRLFAVRERGVGSRECGQSIESLALSFPIFEVRIRADILLDATLPVGGP